MATLFTAGMTSIASAGCCDWGTPAPVAYASPGCGGCGAPVTYAEPIAPAPIAVSGCGSCGMSSAAVVFAQPVAPSPAPFAAGSWGTGCGCGRSVVYAAPAVAPAPLYVANQGPDYSGPGIMNPYRTYMPAAPATNYPYIPGYGYGPRYGYGAPVLRPRPIYRPHFVVYRERVYAHPRYYAPTPRMRPYWHRPLGVRG
jgi:hypothetical protein